MTEILLKSRYRYLAEIGRGERTVTYKAHDTSLNRMVAVKVLRERYALEEEFVDRFKDAAQAIAALSHPNIVAIYDIGTDRDLHYIVTEYIEGQNLESLVASEGLLGPERALDITIPVSSALGAAHQAGYIHGSLTPRDILVTTDQQVKVSDFSVVATPPPAPAGEESPSRYAALYLSPEQAMGRRPVPASDVYTLGVILYEMLTGHPPFVGESFSAVADKHVREKPEPLESINPQVPRSLSVVVHRALAKASRDRYRTGGALKEALETYRRQSGSLELVERIRAEEERPVPPDALTQQEMEAHRRAMGAMMTPSPAAGQNAGLDWVGCLVGMIAFMAVLGLIPLWVTVFLRYFA